MRGAFSRRKGNRTSRGRLVSSTKRKSSYTKEKSANNVSIRSRKLIKTDGWRRSALERARAERLASQQDSSSDDTTPRRCPTYAPNPGATPPRRLTSLNNVKSRDKAPRRRRRRGSTDGWKYDTMCLDFESYLHTVTLEIVFSYAYPHYTLFRRLADPDLGKSAKELRVSCHTQVLDVKCNDAIYCVSFRSDFKDGRHWATILQLMLFLESKREELKDLWYELQDLEDDISSSSN